VLKQLAGPEAKFWVRNESFVVERGDFAVFADIILGDSTRVLTWGAVFRYSCRSALDPAMRFCSVGRGRRRLLDAGMNNKVSTECPT
jgi:hypothetical protein